MGVSHAAAPPVADDALDSWGQLALRRVLQGERFSALFRGGHVVCASPSLNHVHPSFSPAMRCAATACCCCCVALRCVDAPPASQQVGSATRPASQPLLPPALCPWPAGRCWAQARARTAAPWTAPLMKTCCACCGHRGTSSATPPGASLAGLCRIAAASQPARQGTLGLVLLQQPYAGSRPPSTPCLQRLAGRAAADGRRGRAALRAHLAPPVPLPARGGVRRRGGSAPRQNDSAHRVSAGQRPC